KWLALGDQLTLKQREAIWQAAEAKFETWMREGWNPLDILRYITRPSDALKRDKIWQLVENNLTQWIDGSEKFYFLLSLPIETLDMKKRMQILPIMDESRSYLWMPSRVSFERYFTLPPEQLNDQFRERIFKAAELYFTIWVREGWNPFSFLLTLPEKQLSVKHRNQVIAMIINQLTDRQTLQSGHAFDLFCNLLNLPTETFNSEARTDLSDRIGEQWDLIITHAVLLTVLFNLRTNQLSLEQRTKILENLHHSSLLQLFLNSPQKLLAMFQLPETMFNASQREIIWQAIAMRLNEFIRNERDCMAWLKLSESQLSSIQRQNITQQMILFLMQKFKDEDLSKLKYEDLVNLGDILIDFFECSLEVFSEAQREILWSFIEGRLEDIIKNGVQLARWLAFDDHRLSVDRRAQIMEKCQKKLENGKYSSGPALLALFQLPLEKLNAEMRDLMWKGKTTRPAFDHPLLDICVAREHETPWLYPLFNLSTEQLSVTQRHELWQIIKNNMSDRLSNALQQCHTAYFLEWFRLSMEQFDVEQRWYMFDAAMQNKFSRLDYDAFFDFLKFCPEFFKLSQNQFTAAQRQALLGRIDFIMTLRGIPRDENDKNQFRSFLQQLSLLSQEQFNDEDRAWFVQRLKTRNVDLAHEAECLLQPQGAHVMTGPSTMFYHPERGEKPTENPVSRRPSRDSESDA
ncbi:MAG: hypothetical protein ACD_45C00034G0001, partial [uncultured bacterium]